MDVDQAQTSTKASRPPAFPATQGEERKELAWAFLGLILWSGVVLVGIFGVGYVLGHSLFHLW
jgi:hypothetical protein